MPKRFTVDWTQYIGQKFGHLELLSITGQTRYGTKTGLFKCDCGNIKELRLADIITQRRAISCGCLYNSKNEYHKKTDASKRRIYTIYISGAERRGYTFDLTLEEFVAITQNPCHYCGALPNTIARHKCGDFIYNGVDRLDNTKGYIKGNCVPCCTRCNKAKLDNSYKDFVNMCHMVAAKHPFIEDTPYDTTTDR